MINRIIVVTILLVTSVSIASDSGHSEGQIPWETLQKQVFNFLLVVGLLAYLLRTKVKEFYRSRVETFEKQAVLAKKAKQEAEDQKHEIKNRLEKLQTTAAASIDRAKQEAEELKLKIKSEAEALVKQLRTEAVETAAREIEKAKQELRDEVLTSAMKQTRENMKTSVKEPDQKRLQNEFVSKIQVNR